MKFEGRFVAALLASVSILGISQAYAGASAPEVVSVTADDQTTAGGGGASNVGTIDVQGAGTTLGSGYIVPEDGPKERSTVTQQGIANLIPTSNPYQMISILPGVNQFQDDPLGLSGGTIRVRGLTAAQMGFTVNGAPINDSGSFAVYPNELIDAENVAQVWVTQGSTDIDAPHVGASGGNIGVVTRAPFDYFNVRAEETVGQDSLLREFVSLDTGWVGDFKGFASVSLTDADKWRGDGTDRRWHSDGSLLWQFLPHSSIGLIWSYNDGQNDAYRSYGGAYFYYPGDYEVGTSGHTIRSGAAERTIRSISTVLTRRMRRPATPGRRRTRRSVWSAIQITRRRRRPTSRIIGSSTSIRSRTRLSRCRCTSN
jgi:iron complex outermembrane receptor protein